MGANKKEKEVRWEKKREGNERREKRTKNGEKKKRSFSRHSDYRSSTVREEKSIHKSRATCGYQNLGVSSNSTR